MKRQFLYNIKTHKNTLNFISNQLNVNKIPNFKNKKYILFLKVRNIKLLRKRIFLCAFYL